MMSVFPGGSTLDTAKRVLTGGAMQGWHERGDIRTAAVCHRRCDDVATGHDVIDVHRLRAKSLVIADRASGEVRFRMLASVAVFAADRLAERTYAAVAQGRFLRT